MECYMAHLEHVGKEEEQAGVHASAEADRGQDAQADPPDQIPEPGLRTLQFLAVMP